MSHTSDNYIVSVVIYLSGGSTQTVDQLSSPSNSGRHAIATPRAMQSHLINYKDSAN